jgi:MraZ protein
MTPAARFRGTFEHTLDAKGRISLPAKFRKILPEETLVLVPGPNGQLNLFTEEGFDEWVDSLLGEGSSESDARKDQLVDFYYGASENVDVDAAGRICISAAQRAQTGLDEKVLIKGARSHISLWSQEAWERYMAEFDSRTASYGM